MFSPLQLLTNLKSTLQREEPQLNFDYFEFWMQCFQLLRDIRVVMPKGKSDEAESTVELAFMILAEAAGLKGDQDRLVGGSMLAKAAEVVQKYVDASGGVLLRAAREQSSGHIPEHLWPKHKKSPPL